MPFCPLSWPRGQHNPVLTSPVVIQTAARLGITSAQAALQWLLLIPGPALSLTCVIRAGAVGAGEAHRDPPWADAAAQSGP